MEKACRAFMDSYFQVSENTRKLFCRTIRKSYKYYLSVHLFKCWLGILSVHPVSPVMSNSGWTDTFINICNINAWTDIISKHPS